MKKLESDFRCTYFQSNDFKPPLLCVSVFVFSVFLSVFRQMDANNSGIVIRQTQSESLLFIISMFVFLRFANVDFRAACVKKCDMDLNLFTSSNGKTAAIGALKLAINLRSVDF